MKLSEIWIHPIKACRGISIAEAECTPHGLRHDRRWMLADATTGRFVSQREDARLARVDVALRDGGYEVRCEAGAIELPESIEGEPRDVRIWNDTVAAVDHAKGSELFSTLLERDVRLVFQTGKRATSRGGHVSFADGYPYLLISQSSLDDLNARLEQPIPMTRFRPNFVVTGCAPFAEDEWTELTIGDARFRNVKLCDRCSVPTIDAEGRKGVEPTRTLATYRKREGKVWFGVNLLPDFSRATLRTGASVSPHG